MALNGSKCRQNFCPKLSRPWQSVINATSAHDVRLLCASVDLSCLFVFIFSSYYFVSNVQPFSFCFAILEPIYLFPVQPFVFCFMCSSFIIFFYSLFSIFICYGQPMICFMRSVFLRYFSLSVITVCFRLVSIKPCLSSSHFHF